MEAVDGSSYCILPGLSYYGSVEFVAIPLEVFRFSSFTSYHFVRVMVFDLLH